MREKMESLKIGDRIESDHHSVKIRMKRERLRRKKNKSERKE